MPDRKYILRQPQSISEWSEVKVLLKAYQFEFDDDTCFPSVEKELDDLECIYLNEKKHIQIAFSESPEEISGFVALHHLSDGLAEMRRRYVTPNHRGHHIGKMHINNILTLATE